MADLVYGSLAGEPFVWVPGEAWVVREGAKSSRGATTPRSHEWPGALQDRF
jgi:hypothetical protein